uniref:Caspase a n=1 Tax=Myripristis murdjan TaxID=586833 RepID=A0A667Y532_9TELE
MPHLFLSVAQRLFNVRRQFVDGVTAPVIKDLLNDLLADGVLNERERDSVLEERRARADQAECLIDMVRKKGNEASQKLIDHLKTRDSKLHPVLFPSADQEAVSSHPPVKLAGGSRSFSTHIQRTDKLVGQLETSDMVIIKTRVALLINVRNFVNKKWIREGSEKDDAAMVTLLTALGYRVRYCFRNETKKQTKILDIDKAVKDFAQLPDLSQTDSVFVVIMSHGIMGAVYGSRGKAVNPNEKDDLFPIDNIFEYLNAKNCPALRDKPKVIIIQACRGGDSLIFVIETNPGKCLSRSMKLIVVFLCQIHSTRNVSWRDPDFGSPFIQYLVEVFNTFSHKDHLEKLFTQVMNRFKQGPTPTKRQMPVKDRCSLSTHFYLFPGL